MKFPLPHRSFCAAGLLFLGANCLVAATAPPRAPSADVHAARAHPDETVMIPGPLRSFLRMAGISQEVTPDEVVPLLARSVSLHGYDFGRPTEFLILLNRYVHFARE